MQTELPLLLVADDEEQVRDLIELALASSCRVLLAEDGERARDAYIKTGSGIRLVITDIDMPILDGLGLAAWLLNQPQPPPVILMTGGSSHLAAMARERWVDVPAVRWLDKPFPVRKLLRLVDECLGIVRV